MPIMAEKLLRTDFVARFTPNSFARRVPARRPMPCGGDKSPSYPQLTEGRCVLFWEEGSTFILCVSPSRFDVILRT